MSFIPGMFSHQSKTDDLFSLELWDLFEGWQFNSNSQSLSEDLMPISSDHAVPIDWEETPTAHIFKSNVPGLKNVEVKVETVEDGKVLQISGETSREKDVRNETWHCVEHSCEKFIRTFELPDNANVNEAKTVMENGVLTVTVPKVVEEKLNKTCVWCHGDA